MAGVTGGVFWVCFGVVAGVIGDVFWVCFGVLAGVAGDVFWVFSAAVDGVFEAAVLPTSLGVPRALDGWAAPAAAVVSLLDLFRAPPEPFFASTASVAGAGAGVVTGGSGVAWGETTPLNNNGCHNCFDKKQNGDETSVDCGGS